MSTPAPDFTIAICTYNGAQRLPELLEKLRSQHTADFSWEVVVINNNSTDGTADVVRRFQTDWRGDVPLRYCFEARQGIAYARRRGLQHTTSPFIGFLDDDTLPEPDWVQAAYQFGQAHPQAGAYGGINHAHHEVPPPPNFGRIAPLLAIVDRGDQPFVYPPRPGLLPVGAGMVVRRAAWLAAVPDEPRLSGVSKASLSAKGEDVETLSYIRDAGWEVWYNPAMQLYHHLPAARTERTYLIGLCRAVGRNRFPLRMTRLRRWQRPFLIPLYFLSDLRRLIGHLRQHGRELIGATDVVAAGEWVLLTSTLFSPFHSLKAHWRWGWRPAGSHKVAKISKI